MAESKIINYDLIIRDFLNSVKNWLDARVPRDATEVAQIADTKEAWKLVCANPREYVKYNKLYNDVCGHTDGFTVKRGINKHDVSMLFAVINVLSAMDRYYTTSSDYGKLELADAIKEYKKLVAKNKFAKIKVSLTKPEKLLSVKQR